jgi:hypothetical protein
MDLRSSQDPSEILTFEALQDMAGTLRCSSHEISNSPAPNGLKQSLTATPIWYISILTISTILSRSTAGLYQFFSGDNWGSADMSEAFAVTFLRKLFGPLTVIGIEKSMPTAITEHGKASPGTPDAYLEANNDTRDRYIVSVKRYFVFDQKNDPWKVAVSVLEKGVSGLNIYLQHIKLVGQKILIVLTRDRESAHLVNSVFNELYDVTTIDIHLYIVVVAAEYEVVRMIFQYTVEDKNLMTQKLASVLNTTKIPKIPIFTESDDESSSDNEFERLSTIFGIGFLGCDQPVEN